MAIYEVENVFDEVHMDRVAKFEILDIKVPLLRFQDYFGKEKTKDFYLRINKLLEMYNYKPEQADFSSKVPKAKCLILKAGYWKEMYIVHEPFNDEMEERLVLGREETRALDELGHLDSLVRSIEKEGIKLKSGLWRLDKDSRANIGGIYALMKEGYSAKEIKEKFVKITPEFLKIKRRFFGRTPTEPNFEEYLTT